MRRIASCGKHLALLSLLLTSIAGCSTSPPVSTARLPELERIEPPMPTPPSLEPEPWKVVTIAGQSLYALTADDFQAYLRSKADLLRWGSELVSALNFYRERR